MIKLLNENMEDINEINLSISEIKRIPIVLVEKDMWVSYLLDYLFNRCEYRNYFEFKGGTSLSKAYKLINRFSEDVDILIHTSAFTDERLDDVMKLPSKTQRQKAADKINALAIQFYKERFVPVLKRDIAAEINKPVNITLNEKDLSIYVEYPTAYKDIYVYHAVKLEIGPLAAWLPYEKRMIRSFVQEMYPRFCEKDAFPVLVTKPKRTFWEKAVILHQEANRHNSKMPDRYSRHYYDIHQMYSSFVKEEALTDLALLDEVRRFTMTFYNRAWSCFEDAKPGTFKLIPNEENMNVLGKDYEAMRHMIYDDPKPTFSEIIETMGELEKEINALS